MYGFSSLTTCCRLTPRVRRVMSRIRVLNLSRAFGAMRRSLPSFETKKLTLFRLSHRALRLVDPQSQLVGQEPAHRSHDPLAGAAATNIDVAVVGVPAKAVTASGQFLVWLSTPSLCSAR
jgi:hypothetical protein